MISDTKPLVSEPKVLVTGVEGAGKTLFAVQQADLLASQEGGLVYQVNIRGADPHHLPALPFDVGDLAYNEDGSPTLDKDTGEHMAKWATLEPGSVIIVDEAHKVFPQRGPGRPPRHIEMMAEGRQAGVRFILLSQSPGSIDGFLRDRIHRHYHLERKGNMERATVFEFDHCVMFPRTAWQERKDAQVHFWAFPKKYYGWWQSAKTHGFKLRIPWKIWAALCFIPLALFIGYKVITTVGGVMDEASGLVAAPPGTANVDSEGQGARSSSQGPRRRNQTFTDPDSYVKHFRPLVSVYPWSAPAFQEQEIQARPDLYCMSVGQDGMDGCQCYTEQATPYDVPTERCLYIARHGIYNPHRPPLDADRRLEESERDKPGKARSGPSGVPAMTVIPASNDSIQTAPPEAAPQPSEGFNERIGG